MHGEETVELLCREMRRRFGTEPERIRVVKAPYRICPLGAHIDHQLGTVTALAVDRGVHLAFAPTDTPEVRLASLTFAGEVRFSLEAISPRQPGDWGNYARGAAVALSRHGLLTRGIVGITTGDLAEVGLSSSASIGVAYLLALESANEIRVSAASNIKLDQAIENQYLGLNNGILDQSAILLSRHEHLTVIDCRAFADASGPVESAQNPTGIRLVPQPAVRKPFAILVAFSGVIQAILSTDYNRRVAECREAARLLLEAAGRNGARAVLADVSAEEYAALRACLSGALARRAEHFFSEMKRVEQGIRAWERGDVGAFGRLMTESGESSIINYECGCRPLIDLHEILVKTPGILGARFSGAGFRGCCVAVAESDAVSSAVEEVRQRYASRQPELATRARFFTCQSADGARIL